jgi:hypothetical protein
MSAQASPTISAAAKSAMVLGQDLPFWYLINVTLTANQSGIAGNVTTDNDADFELRELIATSTGSFQIQLVDRFTSRPLIPQNLTDNLGNIVFGVNSASIFGTGQLPFILPIPYILLRQSTVAGLFKDTSGAGNTIQLALWGYKKFGS